MSRRAWLTGGTGVAGLLGAVPPAGAAPSAQPARPAAVPDPPRAPFVIEAGWAFTVDAAVHKVWQPLDREGWFR